MDKMILSARGETLITNDGATILKNLSVLHPTAKIVNIFIGPALFLRRQTKMNSPIFPETKNFSLSKPPKLRTPRPVTVQLQLSLLPGLCLLRAKIC
jgi:hypothetical protein